MGAERGRGWGTVAALTLAAGTLSAFDPVLLVSLPLALLLLAVPPRRPGLVALGIVLVAISLPGLRRGAFGFVERGWALVLGAWFVAFVVFRPGARFLSRALAALGCALASSALVFVFSRSGWAYLDWMIGQHFRGAASHVATLWGAAAEREPWAGPVVDGIYQAAELQALLYPALLSLGSLAALGVAWWAHRRIAVRDARPFEPLREFRFRDELVWVLIVGILLIVLPLGQQAWRMGSNVLAFMGALYALRGVAVFLAVTGVSWVGAVLLGIMGLLVLPMLLIAAAIVGLTDTWIDLRARRSPAGSGS